MQGPWKTVRLVKNGTSWKLLSPKDKVKDREQEENKFKVKKKTLFPSKNSASSTSNQSEYALSHILFSYAYPMKRYFGMATVRSLWEHFC